MRGFQERIYHEYLELSSKIHKLKSFKDLRYFKGIEPEQATLLGIQLSAMETYLATLSARLKSFEHLRYRE